MNPIGNTGFMNTPPIEYTNYFNNLKNNTPKKDDLDHNSILPTDPKELAKRKAINDFKQLHMETNKILPMKTYTDKADTGVHSEKGIHNNTLKPSTPHVNIHEQKHISATPQPKLMTFEELKDYNTMMIEQDLAPIDPTTYYPVKTKVNMNLPLPKPKPQPPKPKVDSKGFPLNLPSIADAVKNPTPNIRAGEKGSIQNPIYSTDKQTSKPKPKAKPMYKTDAMGFPILGSEYDIGNVSSSSSF